MENCHCKHDFPIVLQYALTENLIVCSNCNLDKFIDNLPVDLQRKMEEWNAGYAIEYKKWLESQGSESLTDIKWKINQLGFKITTELNQFYHTFYWWHVDEDEQHKFCPKCRQNLMSVKNEYGDEQHKICEDCMILVND